MCWPTTVHDRFEYVSSQIWPGEERWERLGRQWATSEGARGGGDGVGTHDLGHEHEGADEEPVAGRAPGGREPALEPAEQDERGRRHLVRELGPVEGVRDEQGQRGPWGAACGGGGGWGRGGEGREVGAREEVGDLGVGGWERIRWGGRAGASRAQPRRDRQRGERGGRQGVSLLLWTRGTADRGQVVWQRKGVRGPVLGKAHRVGGLTTRASRARERAREGVTHKGRAGPSGVLLAVPLAAAGAGGRGGGRRG